MFVDGDRGGNLIIREVMAVADVDFVVRAPDGKEVEELTGKEILISLRKKISSKEFLKKSNGFSDNSNPESSGEIKEKLRKKHESIKGSRSALLLDSRLDVIRKIGIKEAIKAVDNSRKDVFAIILDGTVVSSLLKICEEKNVKYLAATNFGNVKETSLNLVSL